MLEGEKNLRLQGSAAGNIPQTQFQPGVTWQHEMLTVAGAVNLWKFK